VKVKGLSYWLPRIMVIVFVLSLVFPAPAFVRGLGGDAYLLWVARLIWVISVPLVFGASLLLVAAFRKKKNPKS